LDTVESLSWRLFRAVRDGDRAVDQPLDHRDAWGAVVALGERRARSDVPIHLARR
jgi:hypothetical protein